MKKMRKLFALLMALSMIMALAVSANAASISVTRDESYDGSSGRTYTAYKIFDAEYDQLNGSNDQDDKNPVYTPDDAAVSYSMALTNPWLTAMQAAGQTWFDVKLSADGTKYVVTLKEGVANNADTAKAIAAYLNENIPQGVQGTTVTPGTAATVDEGYYFMVASDGATNLALVTTDITMVEKNAYITTSKTTSETSYSVGDKVTYTATVNIPADADPEEDIILHDEMSEVLAFDSESLALAENSADAGYELVEDPEDGHTFDIVITMDEDLLGETVIFTYEAEVTSAAATDEGFVNRLFGEKNGYQTNPSTPKVYVFDFTFEKEFVGSQDGNLKATFELFTEEQYAALNDNNEETTATPISFVKNGNNYVKADSDDTGAVTSIEAANLAEVNINGLKAGTYYLVETATATGYNQLDEAVTVTIADTSTEDGISHTVNGGASNVAIEIENNAGAVLPSTGGIGTTIFTVVGATLMIGAAVLFITKKRSIN